MPVSPPIFLGTLPDNLDDEEDENKTKYIEVTEDNLPPKSTVKTKTLIKFGQPIDLDIRYKTDLKVKFDVVSKIIINKCYFDPKYYKFDPVKRIIYSIDNSVLLHLNFNFVLVDLKYLYFIMSVMQLNVLGLLNDDDTKRHINVISEYLSLKMKIKFQKRFAKISRLVLGREIESITLELTDEEFMAEFNRQILRSKFEFNEPFHKDKDKSSDFDSS